MQRIDLIKCFNDTLNLSYSLLRCKTKKAQASSKVFREKFVSSKNPMLPKCEIIVEENTTFASARRYLKFGKTAVLNFANPENPGGGVKYGAMAQEECLCRCSNIYTCLVSANVISEYYNYHKNLNNCFYTDRLIYTQNVTVFKTDDEIPQLMKTKEWFNVDFITCAAPYLAKRRYTNKTALKELLKERIKNIFESAIENDIKVIVLGAFGCGAFKNPPDVVASAFKEVIDENNYHNKFAKIVFAIKRTNETPCPNILAFEYAFLGFSEDANMLHSCGGCGRNLNLIVFPSGRELKSNEQILEFREWQKNNYYFKKQFSILGDSISTLEGYIPIEYNCFYYGNNCSRTGVHKMKDTWWGQVIDYLGGELLVNNSWSESRVTKLPDSNGLFPSGCSDERIKSLHINNIIPDVIIVCLGVNDFANGVALYFDNFETKLFTGQFFETFFDAYESMLQNIKWHYPKTEIWCCTLSRSFISEKPEFLFPFEYGGQHIESYNAIIKIVAKEFNCKVIDLYDYCIAYDTIDGTHPNKAGMDTIATLVLREVIDDESAGFLSCEENEHRYFITEKYTGGTKYVCRKCGNKYDSTSLYDNKKNNESEYVIRFPDKTSLLYFEKDGIDLFSVNTKERIKICKRIINVGRDSVCEILFDKSLNFISDLHATFILEKGDWYIRDNESVHGTYINGDKMQPKKKYRLYPDDIIDFGKSEKFIFFVSNSSKRDLELDGEHDRVDFEIKARSVNNLVVTVINNKYRLKSILSFGGMSTVFLASIDGSNKKYAVKTIDLLATGENRVINLVYAEVDLRMKLKHQYIQQVEDLVQTQQYLFIVMDYIEGETLDRMVLENGVLQPELVVNYAKQIASVLQYMHSQNPPVIYRDIKPSNIMITDEGTIRLFDFGVVSNYGKYNDEDIEIYGTRGYAPPEQYVAKEDCRSDVFSLGMTMHYLLTGVDPCAYPYEYKSIRLYNPKLPIDLEYIIDKCTQLDPNKRYQNCEELICDLNNDNLPHS